jgi:hypothetical protein
VGGLTPQKQHGFPDVCGGGGGVDTEQRFPGGWGARSSIKNSGKGFCYGNPKKTVRLSFIYS